MAGNPLHVLLEAWNVTEDVAVKPLENVVVTLLLSGYDPEGVMYMSRAERLSFKECTFAAEAAEYAFKIGSHSGSLSSLQPVSVQ